MRVGPYIASLFQCVRNNGARCRPSPPVAAGPGSGSERGCPGGLYLAGPRRGLSVYAAASSTTRTLRAGPTPAGCEASHDLGCGPRPLRCPLRCTRLRHQTRPEASPASPDIAGPASAPRPTAIRPVGDPDRSMPRYGRWGEAAAPDATALHAADRTPRPPPPAQTAGPPCMPGRSAAPTPDPDAPTVRCPDARRPGRPLARHPPARHPPKFRRARRARPLRERGGGKREGGGRGGSGGRGWRGARGWPGSRDPTPDAKPDGPLSRR